MFGYGWDVLGGTIYLYTMCERTKIVNIVHLIFFVCQARLCARSSRIMRCVGDIAFGDSSGRGGIGYSFDRSRWVRATAPIDSGRWVLAHERMGSRQEFILRIPGRPGTSLLLRSSLNKPERCAWPRLL